MKRIISTLLAALMLFSLCACTDGGTSPKDKDGKDDSGKNDAKNDRLSVVFDYDSGESTADDGTKYFEYTESKATVTEGRDRLAVAKMNEELSSFYAELDEARGSTEKDAREFFINSAGYDPLYFRFYADSFVMRGDSAVLSLCTDVYSYWGGAHGTSSRYVLNFDSVSGERIYFNDLSADSDALYDFVLKYITQLAKGYGGYEQISLESLPSLIDNEQWYFGTDGLTIYADAYQVASYAAGRIGFTISYEELSDLLYEKYIPTYGVSDNDEPMSAACPGELDLSESEKVGSIVIDPEGQEVVLTVDEEIYNLRIYGVVLADGGMELNKTSEYMYCSSLDTDEYLTVTVYIPDVYCNVVVSYMTANGTFVQRGIYQSGNDGSVYLDDCDGMI